MEDGVSGAMTVSVHGGYRESTEAPGLEETRILSRASCSSAPPLRAATYGIGHAIGVAVAG
jgi:hypothetical protein